jgi:tRNA A37 methylthiotransferase MiaB
MALSKKQARRVAFVMVGCLGKQQALTLMGKMNTAAYGSKPKKSLRSFRRILKSISAFQGIKPTRIKSVAA